jgi:hypothetical protein
VAKVLPGVLNLGVDGLDQAFLPSTLSHGKLLSIAASNVLPFVALMICFSILTGTTSPITKVLWTEFLT